MAAKEHLVVLKLATLLAGCSAMSGIDERYPGGWPAPLVGTDCPELTGTFVDRGSYSYSPKGGSHYLSYRLGLPLTREEFKTVEAVSLSPTSRTELRAQALTSGKVVAEKLISLEAGDFTCAAGSLVFPSKSETTADGFGVVSQKWSLSLKRATDGSLIGKEELSGASLALYLVPLGGTQTFWYRWVLQ